ncbi:MAG: NAD(P)-binding protein [Proteobacteria bacterium]|nr:NAD(P)-binding protein [Pseudomonadota bacterium]
MAMKPAEMTQVLALTTRKGVGSLRWQKPQWVDFLPPCNHACPAGEDIQAWLALAQAGRYEDAWRKLVENNPLPATHGRACYHPCESSCNRAALDAPIAIHAVERFLGDLASDSGWTVPVAAPSGKRVLVVGAGPAGLSCAWHLARMGHAVELRDENPEPGGMMAYGIPEYRLPRDDLQREIARVTALPGVTLRCGERVDDVARARREGGFDAAFVAVGAQLGNHLDIPAVDGRRIMDAVDLLEQVNRDEPPALGRVVVVVGGGNTAMDVARTAQRLGAEEAVLVYRRDAARLTADPDEAAEARAEGVKVRWVSTVQQFGAKGVVIEKMQMNADGSVTPTGETEQLAADSVVLAVGQHSDLSLLSGAPKAVIAKGVVQVGPQQMTGEDGLFAGGDCIGGARTMTTAVGHGKAAARHIDAWLRGQPYVHRTSNRIVDSGDLHLPGYLEAPRSLQQALAPELRTDFGEVVAGLSETQARYEAERCLSCGNCFECDNCFAACPEQAIRRLGPGQGYAVELDLCTGCAVCFEQCPCHAIEMAPDNLTASGDRRPDQALLPIGSLGEPVAPSRFKVRP